MKSSKSIPNSCAWLTATFGIIGLGAVAFWLILSNLGCIIIRLIDGDSEINFKPRFMHVLPNTSSEIQAMVTWLDLSGRYLESDWSISNPTDSHFSSVKIKPVEDYAVINFTTKGAEQLYSNEGWGGISSKPDPVVTARFIDPSSYLILEEPVKVTRRRQLPVGPIAPKLSLKLPVVRPIVSGDGFVRSIMLGAKAEITDAPDLLKYDFKFKLVVDAHGGRYVGDDDRAEWVRFSLLDLRDKQLPTEIAADGQSAVFKYTSLKIPGMEQIFEKYTDVSGAYKIEVWVEARTVGGKDSLPLKTVAKNSSLKVVY
jgi:hypothetical protein